MFLLLLLSSGLTSAQLSQLRDKLRAAGIGKQGATRDEADQLRAIFSVGVLQQRFSFSNDAAIKAVAAVEMATPRTIRCAVSSYASSGTVTPTSTEHRGRGNVNHPLHTIESIPFEGEILLHRHLTDVRQRDTYESSVTLQSALLKELDVKVSQSTVLRWLKNNNYMFRKKRFMGTLPESLKNQRMRAYVAAYARAVREERNGTAVIVYMDESYVHSQHNKKAAWLLNTDLPDAADVKANERGGIRLIIIHAITKDGMLQMPDIDVSNDLTNEELSCEFIFQSAGVNDNYHSTINGSKWVAWLNNRLIPTFKARYPGKKMILVLDNARYHHARPFDWITPSSMSKKECETFLLHHHIDCITSMRDGVENTFTAATYDKRGKAAPTLVEMKAAVAAHLHSHPHLNSTLPQRAMSKEGWQLLYTPPYAPEVQPIELVWGAVKHTVAAQSSNDRTPTETRHQTEVAFEAMTADACVARILHCQQWMSAWLRTAGADELATYTDFEDVVTRLPDSTLQAPSLPIDVDAIDVD